ncbi:MAG: TolC family protein, partial [Phycisphaerae bacterium]|nr:TolC family protein [Phycisphaerae bacterium]
MHRQSLLVGTILAVSMIWASGCRPQQPHYLFEDGDLSHYVGEATNIEFPDARVESLDEVAMDGQNRPLTLEHGIDPDKIWELSLEKAVQCALANNKIMRVLQQPLGQSQDYLTRMPGTVQSVYDPALAETDPLSGPEAALSAFDAQLNASLYWELNDRPRNVIQNVIVSQFSVPTLQQDLGTFMAEISKTTASGTTLGVRHNVRYDMNNSPTRQWASDWNVDVEAEFRQPLLQGAGVQFNRIAGPGAAPGIYNGVVIARINSDIRLAEFEAGVRNLVSDVERAYWELYYAYRKLDAAKKARNSTLELWQQVYDRLLVGAPGGDVASEAQVREQYFFYLKTAEATLSDLYAVENNLRYIMGISATDGRLIRPSDEPTTAKIEFPWAQVHYEAMAR